MHKSVLLALMCSTLIACGGELNNILDNCNEDTGSGSAVCNDDNSDDDQADDDNSGDDHTDDDNSDDDHTDDDNSDDDHKDDDVVNIKDPQSIFFDWENDTSALVEGRPSNVVVVYNSATRSHEVELTAFGRTVTFTEDDLHIYHDDGLQQADITNGWLYVKELDDGTEVLLINYEGTWDEAHNRTLGYRYVVQYHAALDSDDEGSSEVFYDVFGDETAAGDMPISGSATYNGKARGETVFVDDSDFRIYTSDITLTANFGSSTIYGSASPAEYDDGTSGDIGLNIDETSITGNTFTTTLSVDTSTLTCADCPTITSSEVNGAFFGPGAEEVGGSYSFTSETTEGDVYIDQGSFAAKK